MQGNMTLLKDLIHQDDMMFVEWLTVKLKGSLYEYQFTYEKNGIQPDPFIWHLPVTWYKLSDDCLRLQVVIQF